MKLGGIYEPIRDQLEVIDKKLRNGVFSDNELGQLNDYILTNPGKRLRPSLVLLSSGIGDPDPHLPIKSEDKLICTAIAVEIIHTATLIHDDVVDNSDLRRGQKSVASKWGKGITIIFGDYWFSKAVSILSREVPEAIQPLMDVISTMCSGELEQLQRRFDLSLTEGEYLEIVEKKTASLMSACCQLGAKIGGASQREIQSLSNYGLNLGIAFQITDDCLDLIGSKKKMGKSLGSDIREGKLTLPLIHTINAANKEKREWIKNVLQTRQVNSEALNQMRDMVRRYGGIEYALKKGNEFKEISKEKLESFEESKIKKALNLVADYVTKRVMLKSHSWI